MRELEKKLGYEFKDRALLERGVLAAPAQFEALFVSAAHSRADLERVLAAMEEALRESTEGGK